MSAPLSLKNMIVLKAEVIEALQHAACCMLHGSVTNDADSQLETVHQAP